MTTLAVSLAGTLVLYLLLRAQALLPYSLGHPGVSPALAFNTAVSFTTNTSWQNYPGETTLGGLAQAAGLGTEAFLSAAVGLAAALALIRGLVRRETDRVGNCWVDLTRAVTRLLIPLALAFGIALAGLGVIENLSGPQLVAALAGGTQRIPGGLVASWEPIKLLSGDGGGFFNANSAHPFENPAPLTNLIEIVAMLLIPVACIRMYGRMVGPRRQGWTLLAVAGVLFAGWTAITMAAESQPAGPAPAAARAAMEGKQTAFGVPGSALFGVAATSSADGAANASYDSFTALGGGMLLSAMMLGEVSPGGVGSGLTEVIYAFTSSASSNGSAFGGLSGNTTFYNVALAVVMLAGRYLPIVFVLALAGSFARQKPVAVTSATLRTHGPTFAALTLGVALVLVFLTFLPALSLGPLAEGLR